MRIPGNRAVQQPRVDQNSGSALCCTRTACEFEVPLGVGNSLSLEVTLRCNEEASNCPPDLT